MVKTVAIVVLVSVLAGFLTVFLMGRVALYVLDHTMPERGVYAPEVTLYEDGSWEDTDGNSGCFAGGLCND